MKAIYAGTDGKLRAEKIKEGKEFVEFEDGYHPLPEDAIFYSEEGGDPVVAFFGQILNPVGTKTTKQNIQKYCAGVELTKQSGNKVSLSSKLWRNLRELRKHIGWIIILIVLAYAFLTSSGGV